MEKKERRRRRKKRKGVEGEKDKKEKKKKKKKKGIVGLSIIPVIQLCYWPQETPPPRSPQRRWWGQWGFSKPFPPPSPAL